MKSVQEAQKCSRELDLSGLPDEDELATRYAKRTKQKARQAQELSTQWEGKALHGETPQKDERCRKWTFKN